MKNRKLRKQFWLNDDENMQLKINSFRRGFTIENDYIRYLIANDHIIFDNKFSQILKNFNRFQKSFLQAIKLLILNHKLLILINSMELKSLDENSVNKIKKFCSDKIDEIEKLNIDSLEDILDFNILTSLSSDSYV